MVQIAPQITGPLADVPVANNQLVKKGDLLFTIDPRPFQIAKQQAEANLALARQGSGAESATVREAEAQVRDQQAVLTKAQEDADRIFKLVAEGDYSKARGDEATESLKTAQEGLAEAKAKANLKKAQETLGKSGDANANVQLAQAALAAAELNLAYTKVTAPADGWVTNLSVRPGSMVSSGVPLFAIVQSDEWWVAANFKETDLLRIQPGQKASISVDMYPGLSLTGTVESLSAGSGAAFSLLPPENATGNWVKVTQRFPVRIRIPTPSEAKPLRIGASTSVTVDTRSAP